MTSMNSSIAWAIPAQASSVEHLERRLVPIPAPNENQVLIRMTAASLNYRDLLVAKRSLSIPVNTSQISCHALTVPVSFILQALRRTGPVVKGRKFFFIPMSGCQVM